MDDLTDKYVNQGSLVQLAMNRCTCREGKMSLLTRKSMCFMISTARDELEGCELQPYPSVGYLGAK